MSGSVSSSVGSNEFFEKQWEFERTLRNEEVEGNFLWLPQSLTQKKEFKNDAEIASLDLYQMVRVSLLRYNSYSREYHMNLQKVIKDPSRYLLKSWTKPENGEVEETFIEDLNLKVGAKLRFFRSQGCLYFEVLSSGMHASDHCLSLYMRLCYYLSFILLLFIYLFFKWHFSFF